jgi:ATP-dependent metalloprotease
MSRSRGFLNALVSISQIALYAFIIYKIYETLDDSGGSSGGVMEILGKKPKEARVEEISERLADVIGCDDVLDELRELVDFLQNPQKYLDMGASVPRGVLLTGPPGTGKTLSARAIAGEAGVHFLWASAADFDEVFVGTGPRRVRQLFAEARLKAPCIIFIDEIDSLGNRSERASGGGSNTLNSILVEMDGFEGSENVMVMAATNFPDRLDEALTRPGRFDRKLALSAPDLKGRVDLFRHFVGKTRHAQELDLKRLAASMIGATGADIKTIVNNAAVRAAKLDKAVVGEDDLEEAKENWAMGVANRSKVYSRESLERTAYHEGGHALVALLTQGGDAIYKATILPRGGALGYVSFTNGEDTDSYSVTHRQYRAKLDTAMGGRVAEELVYGADNVTSGAAQDLVQATNIARNMVMRFGYGNAIGKLTVTDRAPVSPETQRRVDEEAQQLLEDAYRRAKELLVRNRDKLELLARGLLEHETVTAADIRLLISGQPLVRAGHVSAEVPKEGEAVVV